MEKVEEKDIRYMMECRALFFFSINYLIGVKVTEGDVFNTIFNAFVKEKIRLYPYPLSLILCFQRTPEGTLKVYEDEEWQPLFDTYMNSLDNSNSETLNRIYEDVGEVNVDLISRMAEGFVDYMSKYDTDSYVRIKQ